MSRDPLVVSEVMTCSHCGVSFADRSEQVGHYKSDFHKYNVKRSAAGQLALTERQFDRLSLDGKRSAPPEWEEGFDCSRWVRDGTRLE